MTEILNCPFCDEAPKVRDLNEKYPAEGDSPAGEYTVWTYISCDGCGIEMGSEYLSEVTADWNTRGGVRPDEEDDEETTVPLAWLEVGEGKWVGQAATVDEVKRIAASLELVQPNEK